MHVVKKKYNCAHLFPDDDFIEVNIDPNAAKADDDLFPASIFQQAQSQKENTSEPTLPESKVKLCKNC